MATTPEEQARLRLRKVGLVVLVVGVLAEAALEELHRFRYRLNEANRRAWRRVEGTPGSLLIEWATALLEGTNQPLDRRPATRRMRQR